MTVDEIYGNIRYNENLIDQYTNERRALEAQIEELDLLRSKYSGLQSRFEQRQQKRQSKLQSFLSSTLSNQILRKYYSGMNSLLTGTEYGNAYAGLGEAKSKITSQINRLDDEIDTCNANIRYRRERREYWLRELNAALAAQEGE